MVEFTKMGQMSVWDAVGTAFALAAMCAFFTWAVITWDSAAFWRGLLGPEPDARTFLQRMRGHLDWSLRRREDALVCLDGDGVGQAGRYALFCIESLGGLGAVW